MKLALLVGALVLACAENNGPEPRIDLTTSVVALSIEQGQTASFTLSVARTGGFSGEVTVAADPLPNGIGVVASPSVLSESATSSSITVTVARSVAPQAYSLVLRASASDVDPVTTSLSLHVTAAPDFSVAVAPEALTIPQGLSARVTISIGRANFPGAVSLSIENSPLGLSAVFSPQSVTATSSDLLLCVQTD